VPDTACGDPPLLQMRSVVKRYPGVRAVGGVDLALERGEVLALLGENGAGKSTLMKILAGAVRPDAGTILVDGEPVALRTPQAARAAGIAVIHQEFTLVPGLTAAENIFLGREPTRRGLVDRAAEGRRAAELFRRLGVDVDVDAPCGRLSTAQQQLVEIAKALASGPRILVLDEPTAALTAAESTRLFAIVRDLVADGLGAIFIGHRLEEIFALAHRLTVLRDGLVVGEGPVADFDRERLISLMVGRDVPRFPAGGLARFPAGGLARFPAGGLARFSAGGLARFSAGGLARQSSRTPRLEVRNLRRGTAVRDVSFAVNPGEIVALAGLVGAGRTETVRLIFGADRPDAGEILRDGRPVRIRTPRDAIAAGIGLLTEDRKREGLLLGRPVRETMSLAVLDRLSRGGLLRLDRERRDVAAHVARLRIRLAGPEAAAGTLSGGNQQKVVLAKWLARDCDVLIFDEPTRGIDVGAREEIYRLMRELAAAGRALVMVSSDLPEVLALADRILVMHDGRITGALVNGPDVTEESVMRLAVA